LETDEGVVEAVGEGDADVVTNGDDGGAMPTMDLETAQAPGWALERQAGEQQERSYNWRQKEVAATE
jgi:hypothetical protein